MPIRAALLLLLFIEPLSAAAEPQTVDDPWVADIRYRFAHIDTAGFAAPANASTLRVTLGYRWDFAPQWTAYAEGTRVFGLFGDDYNSGANGKSGLPSESDPPSSEISSAWIEFHGDDYAARAGRQYVNLDDQRFFTSGLWRQNPQSFDAIATEWQPFDGTRLRYFYLDNVQRTVGHDYPDPDQRQWSLDGHLLHIDQTLPVGNLAAYAYFVENATQSKYSWRTSGARWSGTEEIAWVQASWNAEFAQQENWRNNPARYTADYRLLEFNAGHPLASIRVGDEVLGGDGSNAFSSPYGSNHAFDGWDSEFKNTPANGLEDRYVGIFGKIAQNWNWSAIVHNFFAQRGNQHYGSEGDASLMYALARGWSTEVDFATYHSNGFAKSERKLWVALEYRHGPPGGG